MAASDTDESPQDDILIALMGQTGTGKSSFINNAAKSSLAVGKTLESCEAPYSHPSSFEQT